MNALKVKLVSFAKVTGKNMKQLVFHILGTKRTATVNFFEDNVAGANTSKRIWVSNLARQSELELELADAKYYQFIEGLTEKKAVEAEGKDLDSHLADFVGTEFELHQVVVQRAGKTYYNWQPYAPQNPETSSQAEGFEDANVKEVE